MVRATRGTLASAAIVLVALGMLLVGQASAGEIVRVRTTPQTISIAISGLGEVSFPGIGNNDSRDTLPSSGLTVTNLSTTLTVDLTIEYEQWVIGESNPHDAVGAECDADQFTREWEPTASPPSSTDEFRITADVDATNTPWDVGDDEAAYVPDDGSAATLDTNIAATGSSTATLDLRLETATMTTFSCQIPMIVIAVDGTLS